MLAPPLLRDNPSATLLKAQLKLLTQAEPEDSEGLVKIKITEMNSWAWSRSGFLPVLPCHSCFREKAAVMVMLTCCYLCWVFWEHSENFKDINVVLSH